MTSRINFLGAKYVVKMGVSGYPSFRLYFFANKARNWSLFSGVLIQKIVCYARGISNKNSVSFYQIPRNYNTALVAKLTFCIKIYRTTSLLKYFHAFEYVVVISSTRDYEYFYSCIYDHFRDFDPHPHVHVHN